jgi:geranylgeranyl reductase family protein
VTNPAAQPLDADVIVVGAGPAGSSTAWWLARAGHEVLLLEKAQFPREKVCGDGLTPRATRQLIAMGIEVSREAGWLHNKGLRVFGGGRQLLLPWPDLASFPTYGLVRPRGEFDLMLAQHAQSAGARLLQQTTVTGPLLADDGQVVGVQVEAVDGAPATYRSRFVVAADGVSSRMALALGAARNERRPLGVAVRAYYTAPGRTNDEWLESWLELPAGPAEGEGRGEAAQRLLPGYGWIFGMGDGTVNVGVGLLNASKDFGRVNTREVLDRWLTTIGPQAGLDPQQCCSPVRGAALPMGFNRKPHYQRGLLLVGDAGGMVNPFNGEGISYAMESGQFAAQALVQALARPTHAEAERALAAYPARLRQEWGGYYTAGRLFVKLISDPRIMRLCTQRGLGHPHLMKLVLKLLANLTDPREGDLYDKLVNTLTRVVPAA